MMGVGEVLMLVGMLALLVTPIDRALTHHRVSQTTVFEDALKRAFPFTPPSPALDALARRAEEALEQDDLLRGVVAIAVTYDYADDGQSAAG